MSNEVSPASCCFLLNVSVPRSVLSAFKEHRKCPLTATEPFAHFACAFKHSPAKTRQSAIGICRFIIKPPSQKPKPPEQVGL
jgi:hypothetical protein